MKERNEIFMGLTKKEAELIAAIRNHKDRFPNGYPRLLEYAQRLFDELVETWEN